MNHRYRFLIALLMLCAYLVLPLDAFAHHASAASATPRGEHSLSCVSAQQPASSHCPCSDRHDSRDCDDSCFCCFCSPCLAPAAHYLLQPRVTSASFSLYDPFRLYPEVYLPIFVPPQNLC